jgi:hypothetical protein
MVRAAERTRMEDLVLAKTPHEATLLQGRVREVRAILSLMSDAERNVAALQDRLRHRLKERNDRFAGDKVKTVGATS